MKPSVVIQPLLKALILLCTSATAQTVNIGDISISPNTQVSTLGVLNNKITGDIVNDGELYVYSNYKNDGLIHFTTNTNTGTTIMAGTSGKQEISGTKLMFWNNIRFDNTTIQPAFLLSNEISISGEANFVQGIIDNKNFEGLIVFENGSSIINASNNSHINGEAQKKGDENFIFPVGDKGNYRFAKITAPEEVTSSFICSYLNENSDLVYPHDKKNKFIDTINNQEYWVLNKLTGTSNVILTLSWDENSTTPQNIIQFPQNVIHIVRWDATQNLWLDEGGIVDSVNKTVTTPVNVSGYSVFTTARINDDKIKVPCASLVIYNMISSNEDGANDYFKIDGLTECSPENTVQIFNRWGVKVFETENYGVNNNIFKGISNGRTTITKNQMLPTGTYFYIVTMKYKIKNNFQYIKKTGYLYLTR